jgi:hypothetical protein
MENPKGRTGVLFDWSSMNKAEFIRRAVLKGYASEQVAEQYAEGQDTFDQSDLVAVYSLRTDPVTRDKAWLSLGDGNYKRRAIFYD